MNMLESCQAIARELKVAVRVTPLCKDTVEAMRGGRIVR